MALSLSCTNLKELSVLGIDRVTSPTLFSNDLKVFKGKCVGYWTEDEGLVLEPIYTLVQRFGDIIRVGLIVEMDGEQHELFGGFSISKNELVIPIIHTFTSKKFWDELRCHNEDSKKVTVS